MHTHRSMQRLPECKWCQPVPLLICNLYCTCMYVFAILQMGIYRALLLAIALTSLLGVADSTTQGKLECCAGQTMQCIVLRSSIVWLMPVAVSSHALGHQITDGCCT